MKTALICTGIFVPIFIAALLYACYWIYSVAFKSPHKHQNEVMRLPKGFNPGADEETFLGWIAEMDKIPYEKVQTLSEDGLKLAGRYYHVSDTAPVVICFHGYRSLPVKDFCGGGILFPEMGYNTLLVYQRAHGDSEGKAITFGIKERRDCICWIKYVISRFGKDVPIMLYGISMGGATVLLASGEADLPKNVKAVVSDCPYSSPREIIKKVSGDLGFPPNPSFPFVLLAARIYGGFGLSKISCVESAKKSPVPILLIHGEADDFVPTYMSDTIARDNPNIQYHTFPGASHAVSYASDKERYVGLVKEFTQKNLGVC